HPGNADAYGRTRGFPRRADGADVQPQGHAVRSLHRHAHQSSAQEARSRRQAVDQDRARRRVSVLQHVRRGDGGVRSLFAKLLLWFRATAVIDFVGAAFNWTLEMNPLQNPFARLVEVQSRAARSAWETGGADALADFERRFRSTSEISAVLTDARGRDLLT